MTTQSPWFFRWASVLLLIQGVLMEGLVFIGLIVLVIIGFPQESVTAHAQVFALPYLQENVYMMMAMSGIALILILRGWFGKRLIGELTSESVPEGKPIAFH